MICDAGYKLIRTTVALSINKVRLRTANGLVAATIPVLCKPSVLDNKIVVAFTVLPITNNKAVDITDCVLLNDDKALMLIHIDKAQLNNMFGTVFKLAVTLGE